jgi:TctA family transporter
MEFIYTKPEVKENSHPKSVVTRVLIHAGVIVLYLLFLALLILIALPLTKMIYSVSIANLKYANYVLTFIFWLIFNIIFYLALVAGNKYLSKEKIEEEHGFEELK